MKTVVLRRGGSGMIPWRAARAALVFIVAFTMVVVFSVARLEAVSDTTVRIPFSSDGVMTLETGIETPDGPGPFPLVVLNHSTPTTAAARLKMHPFGDYNSLRSWLLGHGYAIIIPMRRGFGDSSGPFAEGTGPCDHPDFVKAGSASADDIEAALRYARTQSFVDVTRIVLIGHSGGGLGVLAEASRHPDGVVAVVNFAGGRGAAKPGQDCDSNALVAAMGQFGQQVQVPSLWIYAENDHSFPPTIARAMFAAFSTGSPKAQFAAAPASGNDGHFLIDTTTFWPAALDAFLKQAVPTH